jgi:hypothetical protein
MIRDNRRKERRPGTLARAARSRMASAPVVEPLEGRRLLSLYQGPTMSRALFSDNALYQVSVTGGGFEKISQLGEGHHKLFSITLYGTTSASQLNVTLKTALPGFGKQGTQLQIGQINVVSGLLGAINAASTADLQGAITPLQGGIQTLAFNILGPNAQINALGSVGTFQVGAADLGPNGVVNITGSTTNALSVGTMDLAGGKFLIDGSASGGLSIGSLDITQSGQFLIGSDVSAPSTFGTTTIDGGRFLVSQDVTGLLTTGNLTIQNTGQFIVGNSLSGGLQVNGTEQISTNGLFQVGSDLGSPSVSPGLNVTQNLALDSGGKLLVGRDVYGMSVFGNLTFTPSAGTIAVGGNLNTLTINGYYQGRGIATPELTVGLNLTNLSVAHSIPGQGGISNASIAVGKSIIGLDVSHGIFNSLITAGVDIQNTTVGPDGNDAVFDSMITAGDQISQLQISGNVRSDDVTNPNPTGYRTRIVAGEDAQGNFTQGGSITGAVITGQLIDAVLAASVVPYGGNGSLPVTGYGSSIGYGPPPGDDGYSTYDAPAGVTTVITDTTTTSFDNFTNVSYTTGQAPVAAHNSTIDPIIDDTILPGGSIQATVQGGVISTPHGDNPEAYDFTGLFAADTRGVVIGD